MKFEQLSLESQVSIKAWSETAARNWLKTNLNECIPDELCPRRHDDRRKVSDEPENNPLHWGWNYMKRLLTLSEVSRGDLEAAQAAFHQAILERQSADDSRNGKQCLTVHDIIRATDIITGTVRDSTAAGSKQSDNDSLGSLSWKSDQDSNQDRTTLGEQQTELSKRRRITSTTSTLYEARGLLTEGNHAFDEYAREADAALLKQQSMESSGFGRWGAKRQTKNDFYRQDRPVGKRHANGFSSQAGKQSAPGPSSQTLSAGDHIPTSSPSDAIFRPQGPPMIPNSEEQTTAGDRVSRMQQSVVSSTASPTRISLTTAQDNECSYSPDVSNRPISKFNPTQNPTAQPRTLDLIAPDLEVAQSHYDALFLEQEIRKGKEESSQEFDLTVLQARHKLARVKREQKAAQKLLKDTLIKREPDNVIKQEPDAGADQDNPWILD